jgi:hypothetical protein
LGVEGEIEGDGFVPRSGSTGYTARGPHRSSLAHSSRPSAASPPSPTPTPLQGRSTSTSSSSTATAPPGPTPTTPTTGSTLPSSARIPPKAERSRSNPSKPEASNSSCRGRSIDVKLPDKTRRITSPVDLLLTPCLLFH